MKNKREFISIKYNAKPNVPNKICHKFPIEQLTTVRKLKLKLSETNKAWEFIAECTSPITSLKQILFAFPESKKILNAIDDKMLNEYGKILEVQEEQNNEYKMVDLKYALNLT